jgi:glycolate oxidase iron-sulfur subunit
MRGFAEASIPPSPRSLEHLDSCIVCRACETVCPSGIRMGEMMESFRFEIQRTLPRKGWRHHLLRIVLAELFPYRWKLELLTDLLYLYERAGLRRLVRYLGRKGIARLAALDRLLPPMLPPSERRVATDATLPGGLYRADGKPRLRAALFLGCIASQWFAPVHRATIRVLTRAGCDVVVPDAQTCCGALHRHAGFLRDAEALYSRNRRAFAALDADVVVVNAAGCGAALKEAPHSAPEGLGLPVRDVCELLESIGIPEPELEFRRKVVHDQPCHLVHGQKLPPSVVENLLRQIPGLELLPLAGSERCCGAGGIYNLLHPELSRAILDEKAQSIRASGAEVVVTGNPGCALQILSGLEGSGIDVLHPIEVLDRAYRRPGEVGEGGA